ncbi:uncharacterized protein RCO7_11034 [Rhynchosporium graminicola]|uniref:FAD-binding domain-containing protein n=1 Tax=Rhynchosporium graminicola TaxID=2792576 RepID=A0A1E1KVT4_9HELO|nr:uncharacterized protein RCO7_11034 [Rhynchosporium commune]
MSRLQLNIIIVLEAGNQLSEGGAGIQTSPNAMRILDSMGLKDVFYKEATKNEGAVIRRYKDGKVLGKHRANTLELCGYHNLSMHRADYQKVLYDAALEANAHISFGRKVISVDTSEPSLNLQDGSITTADLMIAADGKSFVMPDSLI